MPAIPTEDHLRRTLSPPWRCSSPLAGGAVWAANKINGKQIKKNSIPGNRIKKNTVAGQQPDQEEHDHQRPDQARLDPADGALAPGALSLA